MSLRQDSITACMARLKSQELVSNQDLIDDLVALGHAEDVSKRRATKTFWTMRTLEVAEKVDKTHHRWLGIEFPAKTKKKTKKKTTTTKKKTTTKTTPPVVVEESTEESTVVEEIAPIIVEESTEEIQVESTEETQEMILPLVEEIAPLIRTETEDEIQEETQEEIQEETQEETPVVVEESTEEIAEEPAVQTQEIETFSDTCVQVAEIGSRKASFTISREGERVEIKNDARTHRFTFPQESDIEQESDRVVLRKMKGSNRALATAVFFMSLKTKQSDPMGCFGDSSARPECEGCALRHLCK